MPPVAGGSDAKGMVVGIGGSGAGNALMAGAEPEEVKPVKI